MKTETITREYIVGLKDHMKSLVEECTKRGLVDYPHLSNIWSKIKHIEGYIDAL